MNVAIAGLGAIGWAVAHAIDKGMPGITLSAVAVRDPDAAAERLRMLGHPPACVALASLADYGDVVVECAGAHVLREMADPVLESGRQLVAMSFRAENLEDQSRDVLQQLETVEREQRHRQRPGRDDDAGQHAERPAEH